MTVNSDFPWEQIADKYAKEFILPWFEMAIKDFPKETVDSRVGGDGDEYNWYSYDFDDINEWYAKWLQQ